MMGLWRHRECEGRILRLQGRLDAAQETIRRLRRQLAEARRELARLRKGEENGEKEANGDDSGQG